jgi:hypothetical protein
MHPCCWGNLFQVLAPLVPVVAGIAFAVKKLLNYMPGGWRPFAQSNKTEIKTCCSAEKHSIQPASKIS